MNTSPQGAPRALILAVMLAALLVAGGTLAWAAWQFSLLEPTVAEALRVAIFLLPIAAALVGLAILWRRYGTHEYIKADHITRLARAQSQRFPNGLQSLSYHDSSRPQLAPASDEQLLELPAPPTPPDVPPFGQLLDRGLVGPGRPLILGFDAETHAPIEGSWSKLYSCGVGGLTGSGKSWAIAFLLAQSVRSSGARIILVDPNNDNDESLANRLAPLAAAYMCDVAKSPAEVAHALQLAAKVLADRIAGRPAPHPIIFVCDEWTSLLRGQLGDLLTQVALDYAEQGRKYGCFAILAAQGWQVDAAGPVRDRLASHYVLRTRGDQFRYQTGLRGSAPLDTLFLKPAEAYLLSTGGDLRKVTIPQMTDRDLAKVGAEIATSANVAGARFGFHVASKPTITPSAQASAPVVMDANGKPAGSLLDVKSDQASAQTQPGQTVSAEAARVAALFMDGLDVAEIVKIMRGVEPGRGGRQYQTAAREISALLRQAMRGA